MTSVSLPMFPLGTVLLPSVALPLAVFEPRYRQLTVDCLQGDGIFGVVLIERGSEVGGGDQRFGIGTTARIVDARPATNGTWRLLTMGDRRIVVRSWLPDAPYPLAEVEEWPDTDVVGPDAVHAAVTLLRRSLALASELSLPAAPATVVLDDDPTTALWQACAAAPVGPLDRHRLLATPGGSQRAALLTQLLVDAEAVLSRRLSEG